MLEGLEVLRYIQRGREVGGNHGETGGGASQEGGHCVYYTLHYTPNYAEYPEYTCD